MNMPVVKKMRSLWFMTKSLSTQKSLHYAGFGNDLIH